MKTMYRITIIAFTFLILICVFYSTYELFKIHKLLLKQENRELKKEIKILKEENQGWAPQDLEDIKMLVDSANKIN